MSQQSFSVQGPAALVAMVMFATIGAAVTSVYLLVLTFFLNLLGVSIPVH